jgi:hypothetical protein
MRFPAGRTKLARSHEHQANGLVRLLASIFAIYGSTNVPAPVVPGWNVLRDAEFAGRADDDV